MKRQTVLVLVVAFFLFTPWASVNVSADIFFDDFDDGNADGWWLGYNQFGQYGNWIIENGSLLQDRGGDGYIALVENLILSSQSIAVDLIENPAKCAGYGGPTIWYQDTMNWVQVRLYPAADLIFVSEIVDGSIATPDGQSFSYPFVSGTYWYNLRVDADSMNGELAVYIDDNYLFTYVVSTPNRTGQSGVFSGNGGTYFDNFSIVPVPSAMLLATLGLTFSGGLLRRRRG